LLPPVYIEELKKHGAEQDDGLPLPDWNAEAHLQFMAAAGIETSVISLSSPQPYSCFQRCSTRKFLLIISINSVCCCSIFNNCVLTCLDSGN
jgi:hypothetical protein